MNRRHVLVALPGIVAWPLAGIAQQPARMYTILWVSTEAEPDPFIAGFRDGMRERGYVEGQTLSFIFRFAPADPDALRAMLPEMVELSADLIVSSGPAIQAMKATTGRTVLFAVSGDPLELGIADSLARPGGHFTGITFMSLDVAQ